MSVIIVGGGMTGATLALAISQLTKGQLPVHLVEAVAPQTADHPGFDARARAGPGNLPAACAHWHLAGDSGLRDGHRHRSRQRSRPRRVCDAGCPRLPN